MLPSGKRKVVYGDDEKAALKARRTLLAEIEAGRPVTVGRDPTLGEHLRWWLDVFVAGQVEAGHLDESTADSYREKIEIHVLPTDIAKAKRNRLSTEDVRAWQRDRLRASSSRGKQYSPRSVGMAHGAVRRALNDAMRDELIGRNVFALVPLPAGQSKPAAPPSEDDAARVFAEMINDKRRVLWLTMLALGPRRGEALGMRWSLTDLDKATTRLHKQIRRVRDAEANPETGRRRGRLVEKQLKTSESRATLSLPAALVELLREHRREQVAARLAARVWLDPDLIFATRVGTPIEPRGVNRAWAAVCKRADVAMKLHDLRHLAASLAFAEGASIKEVQSMLRHTRQATTADIYVHVFESVRKGTADKMDGVLRKIVGA
ncbi:tyrosine-type recombinase/integrase [Actinoplanes sp. CA-142083]|uniref:tyrosine-type recombinase/integrase n=1 Tax=Actinoplanes sp. CA-142083 TaxID=3239903 RepID=UPI003D8D5156